jgi:hypothetical protein
MALSVDYLYSFSKKLIRKNQAGGFSNVEFDLQWNDAQGSYQDDLLGRFQLRGNSKTGQNTGLIEDETILQKLSPFTKPASISIVAGTVTKPTDLVFRLAFRINGEDVTKINHSQIANVNNSSIDPPSIADNEFYFVEYEDYYAVLPSTLPTVAITTADLDYVRTPTNVKWGFSYDANDRQVYNAGTSIQPEWDNNSCREITKRMLTNLGVSFKDQDFANFGKSTQLTGE